MHLIIMQKNCKYTGLSLNISMDVFIMNVIYLSMMYYVEVKLQYRCEFVLTPINISFYMF